MGTKFTLQVTPGTQAGDKLTMRTLSTCLLGAVGRLIFSSSTYAMIQSTGKREAGVQSKGAVSWAGLVLT